MTIRLDAVRSFGRNLKEWCRLTVPLACVARYLSNRPIDWFLFWIGWQFLRRFTDHTFYKRDESNGVDFDDDHSKRRNSKDNRNYDFSKPIAAMRVSSTIGVSQSMMTSLPSALLSNIASYLHPRDVVDLDAILRSGVGIQTRAHYDISIGHEIWKQLWYRDYGDVLLRWKISREAFCRSLIKSSPPSTKVSNYDNNGDSSSCIADECLEEQLSKRLDELAMVSMRTTMKDFYFIFGECYIDYILARKNTPDECYLGLHGHVFDFTDFAEYHPGLIEPILKECGGDATHFFEDIPHSSAARNIARRLCVLVDHSVIDYDDEFNSSCNRYCGLEFVLTDDSLLETKSMLRSSNTRPPPPTSSSKNDGARQKSNWMSHIVPRRRQLRRHPTLERIRTRFLQDQHRHERQQLFSRDVDTQVGHRSSIVTMTTEFISSCTPFWSQQKSRLYYDPLRQEWVRWCPDNSTCLT